MQKKAERLQRLQAGIAQVERRQLLREAGDLRLPGSVGVLELQQLRAAVGGRQQPRCTQVLQLCFVAFKLLVKRLFGAGTQQLLAVFFGSGSRESYRKVGPDSPGWFAEQQGAANEQEIIRWIRHISVEGDGLLMRSKTIIVH